MKSISLGAIRRSRIRSWGVYKFDTKAWYKGRFILCFTWRDEKHHTSNSLDTETKNKIWFANQLIDDACASLAILNVLLNVPEIELGSELEFFRSETIDMSPKMRGLAISNSKLIRETQNSLARPADLWGSISSLTKTTHKASMENKAPTKRRRLGLNVSSSKKRKSTDAGEKVDSFHFIGYVPARGKVWELDGMKSAPLEVGELDSADVDNTEGWEEIVRPVLRLKMEKYGAITDFSLEGMENQGNIQFNLLAIVPDQYEQKSDELELLKRQKAALEEKLTEIYGNDWKEKIDQVRLKQVEAIYPMTTNTTYGKTFARDFGLQAMNTKVSIMNMPGEQVIDTWKTCVDKLLSAKTSVEGEIREAMQIQNENIKRTHDYDPFIRAFLTALNEEGLLSECIHNAQNQ
ncbi:cysteine ase [Pyrrhoderma noxium]|uniref:ubiquitinyl hydrolase 1 n=1 Tax=Pyrrhoderma noxium TaxID=2282107 RepID=A0A286U608_9AGAM|nr:cysteine ase [Pyrrhoderma noxium]